MNDTTQRRTNGFATVLLWLAIVGAINWGLVGFFNFDLVAAIFGGGGRTDASGLSRVIYALVGLAGLGLIVTMPRATARIPRRVTATP
jgi:uncharacterized protein